ncbi:MAG: hypothetical protein IJY31_06165 [Muribaculaceae bacterium]|nr:hypothetical protein [Muribaculaceae bacterium]
MKLKKLFLTSVVIAFGVIQVGAANYLVDGSATSSGTTISYGGIDFVVGTTAFQTFAEFNAASPESNSVLYVAPGTYSENVTFSTPGLKILGSNAYRDWVVTRTTETYMTGIMTLDATGIEVNGFYFTGAGRISAKAATNTSPQSDIKVLYNYFAGSTVARDKGTPLVAIGTRYANENANSVISQCRYRNCEVAHNRFEGSSAQIANPVVLAGVYGTTLVTDNYFYDGGTSVHIDNAQGDLNICHNVFKNVGVTTSTAPDGGSKGDFCIYAMRCAYANSTNLNIRNNEFDGCYGQSSYFSLIRVYPGSSGSTNCVAPVNMKVNINHNTFKNKTSVATNSGQLNENMLMYADKGTTGDVKFNIADNHYDNRFYKFAWVTLDDGIGQREVYSNTFDQFVFGSTYSTMGTSIIDGVDISNHAKNVSLGAVTVLQSMDIDMATGDMYFLQLMNSGDVSSFCSTYGLSATNCDPLVLTRVSCTKKATKSNGTFTYSTTVQKMRIAKAGHGVKLSVVRDKNGQLWMITGGKGSDNGTSNDVSGTAISRFKFVSGKTLILDGSGETDGDVIYFEHPAGLKNAYGAVDESSRYICLSSSGSGTRKYYIYDLDEYLEGNSSPTLIKKVSLKTGDDPITGTGLSNDEGFCTWSYQSYAINGDYLYLLEGESQDTSNPVTSGDPVVVISTYNWRTGQYLLRTRVNYGRINDTFGEPEAFTIRPDVFGNVSAYLGIAVGSSGARKASIFKYHIDRHLDDSGSVIGVDTSTGMKHFKTAQYSGITMSQSANEYSLSASSMAEIPSQSITVTNVGEYLYGSWNGTITGADGKVFSVDISENTPFSDSFKATVTFNPDGLKSGYSAYLRLSSPLATDIVIPINATYTDSSAEPEEPDTPVSTFDDNIIEMTEVWNYSGNTTQPSWLDLSDGSSTGTTTRFIAENSGKLYVLNCKPWGSPEINIIDAYTGEDTGENVNLDGVSGGLTPISSIRFVDGILVGAAAVNANHTFTVYAWKDGVASAPTKILEDTTHGGLIMGSNISVSGNLTDGRIWATDDGCKNVLYYTITGGVVNTTPAVVALIGMDGDSLSLSGSRGASEVVPNDDGTFWVVGQASYPRLFDAAGKQTAIMQAGAFNENNHGTAMNVFDFGSKKYAAAVAYSGTTQTNGYFTLIDVTNGMSASSTYNCKYPENGLGETANAQNLSSLCQSTRNNGKVLDIWICCVLQGVAHYTYNGETETGVEPIKGVSVDNMHICISNGVLSINGIEVAMARLYSISGAMVCDAASNQMDVNGLHGVYILVMNGKNGVVQTRKIVIK